MFYFAKATIFEKKIQNSLQYYYSNTIFVCIYFLPLLSYACMFLHN